MMRHKLKTENVVNRISSVVRARVLWTVTLFAFGIEVAAQDWNGLVPCVSTRQHAEKVLGRDTTASIIGIYPYKKLRVHVHYDRQDTKSPDSDIVSFFAVYLDKPIKLKSYVKRFPNFRTDFIRTELPESITHVYGSGAYTNGERGISLRVQKDDDDEEIIYGFWYFGTDNACEKKLLKTPAKS